MHGGNLFEQYQIKNYKQDIMKILYLYTLIILTFNLKIPKPDF